MLSNSNRIPLSIFIFIHFIPYLISKIFILIIPFNLVPHWFSSHRRPWSLDSNSIGFQFQSSWFLTNFLIYQSQIQLLQSSFNGFSSNYQHSAHDMSPPWNAFAPIPYVNLNIIYFYLSNSILFIFYLKFSFSRVNRWISSSFCFCILCNLQTKSDNSQSLSLNYSRSYWVSL